MKLPVDPTPDDELRALVMVTGAAVIGLILLLLLTVQVAL